LAELQSRLADNTVGAISPQDIRDFLVTAVPSGRGASAVVAAAGASDFLKYQADYVCDGTQATGGDDVEIAAALAAVGVGGKVLLSGGTFYVSKDGINFLDGQHLQGMGIDATTVMLADGENGRVISHTASKSGVTVSDMTLDGNSANQDTDGANRDVHAVAFIGAITNLTLDKLVVKNGWAGAGIRLGTCINARLSNISSTNHGKAGSGFTCDDIFCGDCLILQMVNVQCGDCDDTGIALDGSDVVTITGSVINGPDDNGFTLLPSASGSSANITITGCNIGSVLDGNHAIRIWDNGQSPRTISRVAIVGNTFTGVEFAVGIGSLASGIVIANNTCLADVSANAALVRFEGNPDNVVIRGNTMIAGSDLGIDFVSGSPTDITIEGNNFNGATTAINGTPPSAAECTIRNNKGYNPQGTASITVTASPFTYTCGNTPEAVYIRGGTVSDIAKDSRTIFTDTGHSVYLEPNESVVVTYSSAPTMEKDRK
jgi:hypothetical protein